MSAPQLTGLTARPAPHLPAREVMGRFLCEDVAASTWDLHSALEQERWMRKADTALELARLLGDDATQGQNGGRS